MDSSRHKQRGSPAKGDPAANRSQFFLDIPSGAFYGYNRPGAKVSQGIIQNSWRQAMMGSALAQYENSTLKIYPGFTHGMMTIHADVINADILAFIKGAAVKAA